MLQDALHHCQFCSLMDSVCFTTFINPLQFVVKMVFSDPTLITWELHSGAVFESRDFTSYYTRKLPLPYNSRKPPFIFVITDLVVFSTADEVVPHKHGEKSYHALNLAGFRNLSFKTYEGYHPTIPFESKINHIITYWSLTKTIIQDRSLYRA